MSPRRRRSDSSIGWLVENWALVLALAGWLVTGVAGWVHLEDDGKARDRTQQQFQDRMDYHFGKEW